MKGCFMKKIAALLMTFVLASGLVVLTGTTDTYAAGGSYKLPTSVTTYKYENGKWKKQDRYVYKYDKKGNMVNWDGTKLKLAYKNGKLTKVDIHGRNKDINNLKYWTVKHYDAKGRITDLSYDDGDMNIGFNYYYNSQGYIRKRTNVYNEDYVTTYAFKYYKGGMPRTITEKEDRIKIVETYNKQGVPVSGKKYKGSKLKDSWTNSIITSKGNVTKVIETHKSGKKTTEKWKYEYTYGAAKTTDQKQYAAIVSMTQGALLFRTVGNNSSVGWCWYSYVM